MISTLQCQYWNNAVIASDWLMFISCVLIVNHELLASSKVPVTWKSGHEQNIFLYIDKWRQIIWNDPVVTAPLGSIFTMWILRTEKTSSPLIPGIEASVYLDEILALPGIVHLGFAEFGLFCWHLLKLGFFLFYILKMPNLVFSMGALSAALKLRPRTFLLSAGSITPGIIHYYASNFKKLENLESLIYRSCRISIKCAFPKSIPSSHNLALLK